MPKDTKTYILFIAAPGDLGHEKNIVKNLVNEWNLISGRAKNVRIETTDWSEAIPEFGKRPQAIINEQLFDKSDLVVALFWNKFGTPTGVADSGTEEEILRAIKNGKPLMLYFSDKGIPPSKFDSKGQEQINTFRKKHKDEGLYSVFASDDDFINSFRLHLAGKMNSILTPPEVDSTMAVHEIIEEADQTGAEYRPVKEIEETLRENFPIYMTRLHGIIEPKSNLPNGMKISKANKNKDELKALKEKVAEWNKRILEYTTSFNNDFSDISLYSNDEFKNEIVAKKLWTVEGALTNMDSELHRYRNAYKNIESYKVKDTIQRILDAIKYYRVHLPLKVKSNSCSSPHDFGFEILTKEKTLLTNVVGKGIRSEILHKSDPEHFSLMTRRSIWGLFFLSNESAEFIVDENKDGNWRTVHNWDYLYDYFNYYNYILFNLMKEYFSRNGIKLKNEYKYGYTNLFLVDIFHNNAKNIEELRRYKHVG